MSCNLVPGDGGNGGGVGSAGVHYAQTVRGGGNGGDVRRSAGNVRSSRRTECRAGTGGGSASCAPQHCPLKSYGLRVWVLGFGVLSLEFWVHDSVLRVWGLRLRI